MGEFELKSNILKGFRCMRRKIEQKILPMIFCRVHIVYRKELHVRSAYRFSQPALTAVGLCWLFCGIASFGNKKKSVDSKRTSLRIQLRCVILFRKTACNNLVLDLIPHPERNAHVGVQITCSPHASPSYRKLIKLT